MDDMYSLMREVRKAYDEYSAATNHTQFISYVKDDVVIYEIPVPGFKSVDIKVELKDNIICINGKREVDVENYLGVTEISYSFDLQGAFSNADAEAEVKDGILYLIFKLDKRENSKQITVK
jgi:HSP20 family molecular chaperone IbpA